MVAQVLVIGPGKLEIQGHPSKYHAQVLKTEECRGDGGKRLDAFCRSKGRVVFYINPQGEIAHGKIDKNRELRQALTTVGQCVPSARG